ncbi:MAG: hypothetical protein AB1644_03000 [Candidatus Zixiibacteriota bacterium]
MDFETYLWTSLAAFLTLAIFSFLYKDNPFYKFAEHLMVGTATGYFSILLWHNSLYPNLFAKLSDGHWYKVWLDSSAPWYLIPGFLGALMWTRFSKKYSWMSRWPMALYIGISAGLAVPLEMSNRVNKQLYAMMSNISWETFIGSGLFDPTSALSQLIVLVGALAALSYFFFSKAHTGAFGVLAKFGIWILMIGFGASFGYTVMARISLFIERVQFLNRSWLKTAFDDANPNHSIWFPLIFWLIVVMLIAYIAWEIVQHLKRRESPAA